MVKRNNKATCRLEADLSEFRSIKRIRQNKPQNRPKNGF